jgi:short-subunit dehydrogenase
MDDVKNKTVWITGASSGIGAALAVELNKRGASLVLSARDEQKLAQVCEQCTNTSAKVEIAPLDLSRTEDLMEKASRINEQAGGIDIFIGNAGLSQRSLFNETSFDVIITLVQTNLTANLILVKAVLPTMIERRNGCIVLVSSIAGIFGAPLRAVYSTTKAALHGFAESLAVEVWEKNIQVSMVVPGFVRTNISYNSLKGDGTRHEVMDKNQARGVAPDICARQIVEGLKSGKREIYVGLDMVSKIGLLIKRFFPNLFARMYRRITID